MYIKTLNKLSEKDKQELKNGVIEVTGKAMNRTALGVVAAIFKLFPNITFAELKEMLPDKINQGAPKTFKHGYMPYTDRPYGVVQKKELVDKLCDENRNSDGNINQTHFTEPDEMFKTSDGVTVCVSKLWESKDTVTGENNLQNLIDHVAQYGIKVVNFEGKEGFKKGGYSLKVINPILFEKIQNPPQNNKKLVIAAAVLAGLAIISLLIYQLNKNVKVESQQNVELQVEKEEKKENTVEEVKVKLSKGEKVKDLSINFHNILFEYNSDKIKPESETDLQEAFQFLNDFPNLKVKIIGHTSLEGDANYNQQLSEKRAKAVYDNLIKRGIAKERLSFEGKGSAEPLVNATDEEANNKNRRTEFKILGE
jgi:outer membrane protein OmpA-like peptidoglycan-associated protein